MIPYNSLTARVADSEINEATFFSVHPKSSKQKDVKQSGAALQTDRLLITSSFGIQFPQFIVQLTTGVQMRN